MKEGAGHAVQEDYADAQRHETEIRKTRKKRRIKRKQRKTERRKSKGRTRRGKSEEKKGRSGAEAAGKAGCAYPASEQTHIVDEKARPTMSFWRRKCWVWGSGADGRLAGLGREAKT
jgi:hypothetical protein